MLDGIRIDWRGIDARGVGHTGRAEADVLAFVRSRYEAGWRRLTVTHGGDEVGGIGRYSSETARVWWAESRG